jgi:hypothetical protein
MVWLAFSFLDCWPKNQLNKNSTFEQDLAGECLVLAKKRSSGHARGRSGLPPTADFRAVTSAFALISSALPPGTDLLGGAAEGPFVTQPGHSGSPALRSPAR